MEGGGLSSSPTTSIARVLIAFAVGLVVAVVLCARGVVHSGQGMSDGAARNATLAVGSAALNLSERTGLTWPWDRVEAALGQDTQPALPPLLAASRPRSRSAESVSRLIAAPAPGVRHQSAGRHQKPSGRIRASEPGDIPVWIPTRVHPLRLLVTGDSLVGYVGPALVNDASHGTPITGIVSAHYGTGLARPDFVDWSLVAEGQVKGHRPDEVVVLMGGNDFQNMTLPGGGVVETATPAWTREYQRRVEICMRIWRRRAHRVLWLSMPVTRNPDQAANTVQINLAIQRAARQVPGTQYLDITGPITDHGRYADFVNVHGRPVLVRAQDGVHFTEAGADIVANEVLAVLKQDWHGRRSQP